MKSFTIYEEYYELITLLSSDEEQGRVLLAITRYMFEDREIGLNDKEKKIFINLKRPLNKSKIQSKRSSKQNRIKTELKPNGNQTKTELKPNKNQIKTHEKPNKNTSNDVNVNVNVNVNVIKDIINYLNKKTNSNFKYQTNSTRIKINARLNEGYQLNDFIAVIDKKYDDWKNTEFEKYLCPETLFGTKFEKYLNQKQTKKDISVSWIDKNYEEEIPTNYEIEELEKRLKGR